jgi:hypothetical protein
MDELFGTLSNGEVPEGQTHEAPAPIDPTERQCLISSG